LIQHFGAAAVVEAVRVVRDAKTGVGKGVAFVLFRTQEASKVAMSRREGAQLGGRQLRVTRVSRQAGAAKDGKAATWQQGQTAGGKGKSKNRTVHKPVSGKRKAGGKRPAVKARKQAAGIKASGGVQKRY
jgi:nucleolar protein 12